MKMPLSLRVPTLGIVTGASRGIGRAIALQLAKRIGPSSSLYLTARSKQGLEETAHVISKEVNNNIDITCISSDLSNEKSVTKLTDNLFGDLRKKKSDFSHAILVHNAATLGPLGKYSREVSDAGDIQNYCLLNITSPIVLTSLFLQLFGENSGLRKTVVQLTSRSGVLPQKTMHLYGMGKAARDMYFRVVALEEPQVKVMNFNPGFVNTEMFSGLQGSVMPILDVKDFFFQSNLTFLKPEESAGAMLTAVEEDQFESGATILSYDVMDIDITK
ncbi:hypothetical protein BSL78_05426 [Apostichopus japonicus]|uniref:Sepiapterin reductase n=1 Tax=Stichopus japonicus TaxID=307972 RepID=A0A2G8LBM7_STIJA|nr:hypothetical protein BSL78_05426 [Apostichopus japonicus]